jgi:hypothetical protein
MLPQESERAASAATGAILSNRPNDVDDAVHARRPLAIWSDTADQFTVMLRAAPGVDAYAIRSPRLLH